ncbi:MAG TPA: response regulator [Gemmatimonadales bacterium]|jgi:DNA-binding response OmpR family regulator|nr:response regulator [Gemmatimonadales bacterium]
MAELHPTQGARILVVDDTDANRYAVSRHLQANSFRVTEAATGQDALTRAGTDDPDLIILDVRLPDISGFEVTRRLREDPRTADIPILHISASFTGADSKVRGLDNGADGYLTHPIDPPVMVASVRALLRARGAERQATALARDWSAAFDAIGEGVCIADAAGRITRYNQAFLKLLGIDAADAACITDLIPGAELSPEAPVLRLPGASDTARLELNERWLRFSVVPMAAERHGGGDVVCVVTDLTRERLADERARRALQLESTGRLAGGVAHEVNNMMTVILANAEFALQRTGADPEARAEIEGIHHAAARSAEVARQLLTFSRRQVMQPRPTEVKAVLRSLTGTLGRLLGAGRELRVETAAAGDWVLVDPVALEQVLVNLALNARDAMPSGGTLTIRTSVVELNESTARRYPEIAIRRGPYVQIDVQDTGVGMDARTLDRVFEPFFTTKGVGEGTGLGLSTVFGMVKQSDGYIWASSEPGRGATFSIQLPQLRHEPSASPSAGLERPGAAAGALGTILLVEDEPMVASLLQRGLAQAGYRVEAAGDGHEALEVMQRLDGGVTAVVSDVIMPRMGGSELAIQIRERWPRVPILFMSGYTNDEIIRQGLLPADEAFIQKPFAPSELLTAIERLPQRA